MEKYADLTPIEIDSELLRYATNPGQAVSYKIGYLSILDIKDEYLKKNIDKKDKRVSEKLFNEKLVKAGPLPYDLLRKWILDV